MSSIRLQKIGKLRYSTPGPKGTATIDVTVAGVAGIRKALSGWLEPDLTIALDASNKAAAKELAKALRQEARPVSKRMAKAVRIRRAKTGKPGWVIGSRRKVAFFWPFVIGGTRDHGPRKKRIMFWYDKEGGIAVAHRVSGVPSNPIVERAAKRAERRAFQLADQQMSRSAPT